MPLIDMPEFSGELLDEFAARNTARVNTPVIQPAAPFLDMAGEDLRRRIFLTESETGESLCLRPEFTIPVCLRHIETATGTPKRYAYLGEVFRQRREGGNEFYQAGIEDLGDSDVAAADARAIGDAFGILNRLLPGQTLSARLGDQKVFEAVIAALGLPLGWQKRLVQAFGDTAQLDALLESLSAPSPMNWAPMSRRGGTARDRRGEGSCRVYRQRHAGNRLLHQCKSRTAGDCETPSRETGACRHPSTG